MPLVWLPSTSSNFVRAVSCFIFAQSLNQVTFITCVELSLQANKEGSSLSNLLLLNNSVSAGNLKIYSKLN